MTDEHLRQYMPPGGRLLLLLRAALSYSDDGGPFLVIRRAGNVYQHDVRVERLAANPASMCALTGDDALAFAETHGWRSVLDPTAVELRALMHHAVTLRDVPMWADDFHVYSSHITLPEQQERLRLIERGHRAAAARARLAFVR
ncbi:hypothetical protein [Streptomyces sp. NPDC096105]|uniref:hypothetical protein n=1 Tax=Streptomyces sp. NPDC096105 TaxID=3366074 RepID=UPI0038081261